MSPDSPVSPLKFDRFEQAMNVLTGINRYLEEELKGEHSKECYKGSIYIYDKGILYYILKALLSYTII